MRNADRTKSGTIFNIQKFSVNDGPGIRTVVFFKGCPLRCRWCSNPESQLSIPQILWSEKQCTGKALTSEGKRKTVQEVLNTVLQDRVFYEESGGGITLSGGEFLSQPAFAEELLLASKEEGLHTCCETTGYAQPEIFRHIIRYVDYILFDMKHWDEEKHIEGTGGSNKLPLANMAYAIQSKKHVLPRIPVIPGFNDSPNDAAQFSKRLLELGIKKCQLLPFHQFGENKYDLLNQEYDYKNILSLHREDLEDYLKIFHANNIEAFF